MARNNVDQIILNLAATSGGIVTAKGLRKLGVAGSGIRRRVASGHLRRLHRGIYVVAALESDDSLLYAAAAAYPAGAGCLYTAASAHGFPVTKFRHVQYVVAHGTSTTLPGVKLVETRSLPEDDVVLVGGVRFTSPARTICDLARHLSPARMLHVVENQLVKQRPTDSELVACLSERCRRRARGAADLRNLVSDLLDGQPLTESVLERRLLDGLMSVGLIDIERQFRPPWYDGVRGVVDFADLESRTIIEADGRRFRQVTQAHDNDRRRDRVAASHNWLVVRVGYREFEQRPNAVLEQIRSVIKARLPTPTRQG